MDSGIASVGPTATPIGSFQYGGRRIDVLNLGPSTVWVGARAEVAARAGLPLFAGERRSFTMTDDVPYGIIQVPPRLGLASQKLVKTVAQIGAQVAWIAEAAF